MILIILFFVFFGSRTPRWGMGAGRGFLRGKWRGYYRDAEKYAQTGFGFGQAGFGFG